MKNTCNVLVNSSDYHPFGMLMPERSVGSANYRYAFQGMEQDNEVSGNGNSYTTEFRQYDPRLGRWKSLDPLMHSFPWMSPYVAFDNNPIYYTDPLGLCTDCEEGGEDDVTPKEESVMRKEGYLGSEMPGEFRKGEEGSYRWEDGDVYSKKEETITTPYVRRGNQKDGGWEKKESIKNKTQDIEEVTASARYEPSPDMKIPLHAGSSSVSAGMGVGWQYLKLQIGSGWWEADHDFDMNDFGIGVGTSGGGIDVELLTIGGGVLTINKDYWIKNKTYSLPELFKNSLITFAGGGSGYKYTKITIQTVNGDIIATGYLHQFSLSIGFGGSKSVFGLPVLKMNQADSIGQALKGEATEFKEYLKENIKPYK